LAANKLIFPKAGITEEILVVDSRRQVVIDLPLQNISIYRREKFES